MGSNSSKKKQDTSQYGQIYLKTDKTAYHPGETVTGTIFLNLRSRYPGNQLFLKLKGIEVAHIVKRDGYGWRHRYDSRYSESQGLIDRTTLVHSWNILSTGQFSIPFSILIPPNLPPSFYQQGHRYLAFIEYKLKVFLLPGQEKIPKLKYTQPISLRAPIMPGPEGLVWDVPTQLESCFCCKEGSNSLKVKLEKNNYFPGEDTKVHIKLDNSGTSLKNVKIVATLKQRLELRAGGRRRLKDFVRLRQELPGIPEGSKTLVETLNITLPRFATENDFDIQIDKMKPDTDELDRLTENLQVMTSNTKNRLIFSAYYWEITCPMGGCEPTIPILRCPIGVICPDLKLSVVDPPKNWKPVIMEACILAFPASKIQQNDEKMVSPQEQFGVEMAQIEMPKKPHFEYKPDHFQVFA